MKSEKIETIRNTRVTSVSISNEFSALIEEYNLSPTEIFRKGMAVTLAEMGVEPYNNKRNEQRLELIKTHLQLMDMEKFIFDIDDLIEKLGDIKDGLQKY